MSVSLLTNQAATLATNNLSSVSAKLQQSLNRLASGSKVVNPADDAGGLAVSMKMGAAIKRQAAASNNLSNAISYLQTQDGAMESATSILSRMSELKTLAQDVTKNASDRSNYNTEFLELQRQLNAVNGESFNGKALFGEDATNVYLDGDATTSMEMPAADLLGLGDIPFAPYSKSFQDLDGFSNVSQGTASASIFSEKLRLGTGSNDLARVEGTDDYSGPWEMTFEVEKTAVENDMFRVFVGGTEVFAYDEMNTAQRDVRIVYDGSDSVSIFLDGAGSPTETRSGLGGSVQGSVNMQLTSTVAYASADIDNLSLVSAVAGNDVAAAAAASSLDAVGLSTLTNAIEDVATLRAQNGASQSRLQFAQDQLSVNQSNLEAARSRVMDVDVAAESTQLARFNLLQQAGAAMLSQANQSQQIALRLLG